MIEYALLSALILLSLWMLFQKKRFVLILGMSVFSLFSAGIYAYYRALDVALAEVAVGSAIVPLIFVVATSHQRKFFVYLDDNVPKEKFNEEYLSIFHAFCKTQDISLVLLKEGKRVHFKDVWVHYREDHFVFEGQKSNKLVTRFFAYCDEIACVETERREINEEN